MAVNNHILQQVSYTASFAALSVSLWKRGKAHFSDSVFDFIDNCIQRVVKRPLKYMGDLEKYAKLSKDGYPHTKVSLLLIAMAEQWPFFHDRHAEQEIEINAIWMSRYLTAAALAGENRSTLRNLRDEMTRCTKSKRASAKFEAAFDTSSGHLSDISQEIIRKARDRPPQDELIGFDAEERGRRSLEQELNALAPPAETDDRLGLNKWQRSDIVDAINDRAIAELVLCLCSLHREVRCQALISLRLCLSRLRDPQYSEREQIFLLLGELAETAQEIVDVDPLPSFAEALTVQSMSVLGDPTHVVFSKLNQFLSKSPTWNVSKLPSYWIDRIFLQPSEADGGSAQEIDWLLDVLIDGLRNEAVSRHASAALSFITDV